MLRQLSAIFDTRALGYTSALVAAKVDPDHIDEAAAIISEHPGVSHNYKRNHAYNLWYTLAVPPGELLDEHLDVLHRESGALVTRKLPTLKLYKIGVKLDMTGKTAADAKAEVLEHEQPERRADMPAPELSRPRGRGDPHRAGRPPARRAPVRGRRRADRRHRGRRARDAALVQGPQADAPLRRGDEPPQRGVQGERDGRVGGPRDELDEIGPQMAGFAAVSPLLPAPDLRRLAVHACSRWCTVAARATARRRSTRSATETGVDEYALLWSIKEYKKMRLGTSPPEWDDWRAEHLAPAGRVSPPTCRTATDAADVSAATVPDRRPGACTAPRPASHGRRRRRERGRRPSRIASSFGVRRAASRAPCSRSLATTQGCTR